MEGKNRKVIKNSDILSSLKFEYMKVDHSYSFSNQTWKRLKKNKGALFGLLIIFLALFITIFGYFIAPDSSPNADLQTVEIQAKRPGYVQRFLRIPDKKNIQ